MVLKLDTRLLYNAMGHPGWPKNTHYNTLGMHLEVLENSHNSLENYHIGNNLHLCSKTTWKNLFLKYQDNAKFPSFCLTPEIAFLSYFFSKNGDNSVEN